MKLLWYDMKEPLSDNRFLILADRPLEEGTKVDPTQFIGFIERDRAGAWICYTLLRNQRRYIGFEPSKHYAKVRVLNAIREEIQSRLVLAGETP